MKGLRIVSKPNNAGKELRTSTVLDRQVLDLIKQSMKKNGYGERQRSKWINEAVAKLRAGLESCDEEEKLETLSRATTLSEKGEHITLVLKPESVEFIEACKLFMMSKEPSFEINAQSRLIHFAITFRLIQEQML